MSVGEMIRRRRTQLGWSQQKLADLMGYKSKSTINKIEAGINDVNQETTAKFANVLMVDVGYLLNIPTGVYKTEPTYRIPIVRRVAAGLPLDSAEELIGWEELPARTASNGRYFGLQIQGDSMEPTINDNDIVIVREQPDAEDGDIVVALINGNDGVCKRLKKYDNGMIALVSDNTAYAPLIFNDAEIDNTPVSIRGIVKELRRKF